MSDDYGLTVIEMSFRNFTMRHARSKPRITGFALPLGACRSIELSAGYPSSRAITWTLVI